MNGEPLPLEHGHPLRLVVPGWYAVASVEWLTDIELIDRVLDGHYQVGALVTEPGPGQEVRQGELGIRGVAWSGAAPIARVEVSVAGGGWQEARLVSERMRHSWQSWELVTRVHEPGEVVVRARATDLAGGTQPERADWNRLG